MDCNDLNLDTFVEMLIKKDIEKFGQNSRTTINLIYNHILYCEPCYKSCIEIINKIVKETNSIDVYFNYSKNMRILKQIKNDNKL